MSVMSPLEVTALKSLIDVIAADIVLREYDPKSKAAELLRQKIRTNIAVVRTYLCTADI